MDSENLEQMKARIAELEEENLQLSAAAQAGAEICDLVARWRSPADNISDANLLVLIGEAIDRRRAKLADSLSPTGASNVIAFRKSAQYTNAP